MLVPSGQLAFYFRTFLSLLLVVKTLFIMPHDIVWNAATNSYVVIFLCTRYLQCITLNCLKTFRDYVVLSVVIISYTAADNFCPVFTDFVCHVLFSSEHISLC